MSALVLLNLLNSLRKPYKMLGLKLLNELGKKIKCKALPSIL